MDFHNLKRKELQVLCRKHRIPANLTNLEMAERLTALSAVDEKRPLTRGHRSCLKSVDEIASGNESDLETRPVKKVKFSPDNETIEFEKCAVRYSKVNVGGRRKSAMSGDKVAEKLNEEVSEPGVSGRGKFRGVKVEIKGGKRGKKVDASKSAVAEKVVADRATRRAKKRLLMAGIGVEGGGRKATEVEVIEDEGTTSDVMDGGTGTGKSSEENAKADSLEDNAVENEAMKPKRGRPKKRGRKATEVEVIEDKGTTSDVMDGGDKEAGTGKSSEENAKVDSLEDNATIQNVENEVTRPKRGRPKKRGTSGGMLAASETGKMTARVEGSKELVDGGLNENAKQVRRSRRGKSLEEVQIEDQAGKRTVTAEALKGNGLVDDGVTGEVLRLTRSRRGKSPEGVQIEGKAGNRATKVKALDDIGLVDDEATGEVRQVTRSSRRKSLEGVQNEGKAGNRATKVKALEDIGLVDDGAIREVKGVRRSRRGKSPEGMQVESKPAKIGTTTDKALKSKGVVIDGLNEEPKEVKKSVKGKSSKGAGEDIAKNAVIGKGLIDTGLDAKDVRQSRRGMSAAARHVESKEENKVAKDERVRDKGPVDDGLHGDATEVRRSRRGKAAGGLQVESKAVKKLRKGEEDGLVGDAKEVRRSRRGKSPERLHIESKAGKKVTKDEASIDLGIVDDGLNGDAKEVRSSRTGKSSEVTKVKMDDSIKGRDLVGDSIKDRDLVGGMSGDAREARRISRRRNFTAGSGVSEAKPSDVGDVPSENIQNEEHIEVKKPLLSKREASTEGSEQNGGVRKRSKKSSNVRSQMSGKEEDCEAASESKDVATKSKDVQLNMSSSKVTEVKEISGVDKSKIVDVKECSPAESKLKRSQRSASKLELSMQSTAAVTIRNSKAETRKKGGAVLEFETHPTQESNFNRRLSKKSAHSTGKGEIPVRAAETEKSSEEEDIRSMRTTEAENTSIVDIPTDLDSQAASVEGSAKTNIEDEDTSHVDIPLDLDGQAVLAEDPMGRNIEVEDASNVGISTDFAQAGVEDPKRVNIEVEDTSSVEIPAYLDTQSALAEDPTRVDVEVKDTSNADIPADLDAQAALGEDPARVNIKDIPADLGAQPSGDPTKASISAEHKSTLEVEDISNVDICADVDAGAAATEARTDSLCDNGIVAQLSAKMPQFESTIVEVEDISNVDIRVDVEPAAIEALTDSVCDNGIDAQLIANLPQFESTTVDVEDISNVDIRADVEAAAIEARTNFVCDNGIDSQLSANLPQFESTIVEVEGISNVNICADVEAAAIEAQTDSVCDNVIYAQHSANLPQFESTTVEVEDISNVDIRADVEAAAIEAPTNLACANGIDSQLSANLPQLETTIVEVEDISNVDIRSDVEAAAIETRDSVCDYRIDAQLSANLPQFESIISADSNILVEGQGQASCCEEKYETNDSLATHIRTPLMAEEDCDNTNLECVGELDEQPEDVSASTNSEARSHEDINEGHDSHTTLIRTPLKVGKDCSEGNSELVTDESVMQHEGVLESKKSEAHSDEETAEGNDSQTKNIRTPSTAENDGVDGNLELTDELDKHLETAIESPNSEPLSQTTPLTAWKNHLAGNSVLVIVDSHAQNEAVLKSRNAGSHSHEERAEGNDSQTKKIRTPSTAENVCADGDLVLTDDLDHHDTAIESISEAYYHEGNDFQTHLTEEKDSGDGNLELGVDYLDEQHETVLESIDSEAQSNEESYDGNDSQTTHTGIPLIAEKDCVNLREELSPIKLNSCGAPSTITNFCNPDMSSFEDTKADEIESSKMAAEISEKILEHKSPDGIERSASKILLDRDVSCRKDIAHSSGIQGDMLYYTELSAEGVETEIKFSGSIFNSESMESAQTSPSLELNGKAAREASKAVDSETHLVMSALSPSEQNEGVQPNLDQGMRSAKANEHEDFGHSLESHAEMNSHYESNTDARTSACGTQDLVEEPIAACDTQSMVFSPSSEGTQIVDGGEGYGVCSEANIKERSVSVEAVFTMNTSSSGADAGIVEVTESMDRGFDVEANALDDQPALRMEVGDASCQEETSEGKDSKTTPLIAEKDHMECSLYQVNDEIDKQHAAVGGTTSSEAYSASPCEVREEEVVMLQNSEGKERMQPNLEALKYSEPENSEILINTYDVGSSYNFNDGQAEALQMHTTLNANESKQEEDTTILQQPAEELPVQMSSCGLSASLNIYEHLEMDSLEDLKPVKCDSSEILDTVGRSTSINELQGDIRYPSDMHGEVLAFNEQPAKRVGIASEVSGNADDSGTESFRNSYSFDWDGFEAEFDTGVHGFSFGSNIPPDDCEGYRYPLDHAKVPEEEQGTSLFETQVNEHQINKYEAVSNIQAPDSTEASVSMHYPLISASEVAELLSERRSDNQNCTSQQELDQDLLETAAGSILETEAHQCTGNADEALDQNLVPNLKSNSTLGNSLGGAASEISSAAKQVQKSRDARSILIHGTPKRLPATAHPKGNASVSKVDKVGSLTSVRTAKPPPSGRKPWK